MLVLALFDRRSLQRANSLVMPASENPHMSGLLRRSKHDLKFQSRYKMITNLWGVLGRVAPLLKHYDAVVDMYRKS